MLYTAGGVGPGTMDGDSRSSWASSRAWTDHIKSSQSATTGVSGVTRCESCLCSSFRLVPWVYVSLYARCRYSTACRLVLTTSG